tara:strand:- start:3265 stop:3639 length:375 start_codon:yes stop_codon:yes gene_type:complete
VSDKINIPSIDNHHGDVFKLTHLLDEAIAKNSREAFGPIIEFLSIHCVNHFNEEEELMRTMNFPDLKSHEIEHQRFTNKIKQIKKMYDENLHTTHIAYGIRQLIDAMIFHVQHIDIKMKGLKNE